MTNQETGCKRNAVGLGGLTGGEVPSKKNGRGYCHHGGQSISPPHHLHTWTHPIHQMSLASDTSILFHSSFNLLHMSLIKPHLHIHTTTHIPQQPSKPKHHITHLILQLFPASSLTHLNHFIQDLFQSQTQFTFLIPQASTRFHFYTSILLFTVLPFVAEIYFNFFFKQCEIQFAAKTHCVTVSHVTKVEEDISLVGQIVSPNGAKTLETRNQEMSDKSRNRL